MYTKGLLSIKNLVFFLFFLTTLNFLRARSLYVRLLVILYCAFSDSCHIVCCMHCVCVVETLSIFFILLSSQTGLAGCGCTACIVNPKNLVNKKCSLSQPIVGPEQKFKKFLNVCINEDLFIVFQRPAIYKKPRFFLVLLKSRPKKLHLL